MLFDCPPFSHVHLSEGDPRADPHPDLKGLPLDSENSSFPCIQIMALLSSVNRLVSRLLVDTCPIFPGLFQFHCKGGKMYSLERKLHPASSSWVWQGGCRPSALSQTIWTLPVLHPFSDPKEVRRYLTCSSLHTSMLVSCLSGAVSLRLSRLGSGNSVLLGCYKHRLNG